MKEGWETKKLGEVCISIKDGDWIETKDQSQSGIRLIQTGNIGIGEYLDKPKKARFISQETFQRLSCSQLKLNTILISRLPTPVGRACIFPLLNTDAITSVDVAILDFDQKKIITNYFLFFSQSDEYQLEIDRYLTGTTRLRISKANLKKIRLPLPPITEQKRLVSLLDKSFEAINTAIANTKKSLENAKELFESELNKLFTEKGLNWKEKSLGQIAKINYGYTESASIEAVGPKFLRITDIQDNQVDWDNVPYCKIENSEFAKYVLADGDIVFARTGATTGKSYLVRTPPKSVFASYLIRVQLDSNIILPSFLHLFFQTSLYWNSIKCGSSGSAQGGFNATKLKALGILYPTMLDEQLSLVKKFESLSLSIHQLESTYQKKLTALEELKQSILHQAFSGEL